MIFSRGEKSSNKKFAGVRIKNIKRRKLRINFDFIIFLGIELNLLVWILFNKRRK